MTADTPRRVGETVFLPSAVWDDLECFRHRSTLATLDDAVERAVRAGIAALDTVDEARPANREKAPRASVTATHHDRPGAANDFFRSKGEAATELRISVRLLGDLLTQHRIPVLRFGRRVVLDGKSFAALEAACRSQPRTFQMPERFGSVDRCVPPVTKRGSASADALALIASNTLARKQSRERQKLARRQASLKQKARGG